MLNLQSGFLDNAPVTLIQEQSTGAANTQNSATVSFPGGNWPAGYGFQINLISTTRNNQAIYAQSQMFNISSSGSAGASDSASTTTMMMSSTSSTRTMTPTTMSRSTSSGSETTSAGSAGDASGGIPNAVSQAPDLSFVLASVADASQQTSAPNSAGKVALPALPILGAVAAFFL